MAGIFALGCAYVRNVYGKFDSAAAAIAVAAAAAQVLNVQTILPDLMAGVID